MRDTLQRSKAVAVLLVLSVAYALPKAVIYLYKWWFTPTRWHTSASRHHDVKEWIARTFGIGETTMEMYIRVADENEMGFDDLEQAFENQNSERSGSEDVQ